MIRAGAIALSFAVASLQPAAAQPISLQENFRIGTGSSLLCTGQWLLTDPAIATMFDRAYSIVCRDAAVPVGKVFALRASGDPDQKLASLRAERVGCEPAADVEVEELGQVRTLSCQSSDSELAYNVYMKTRGDTLYVAEGFAGYDSALRLALRSVVADRVVDGEVSVATTGMGDPAAFARVQAGSLDPQRALAEAYRRNNAGAYAEAAEFFGALTSREGADQNRAEAIAN